VLLAAVVRLACDQGFVVPIWLSRPFAAPQTEVLLEEEGNEPVETFVAVAGGRNRQFTLELVIAE